MRHINTNEKITIPAKEIPISEIGIEVVSDTGTKVEMLYSHPLFDTVKHIILWDEVEYIAIGNWTDADVDARIIQLKDSLM